MIGHRQVEQAALFYEFSLDKHGGSRHTRIIPSVALPLLLPARSSDRQHEAD